MWIGTVAIAGVFPFAGFFSKDEIIWSSGAYGYGVLWGVSLIAALLTAGYMTRLMVLTFHGKSRTAPEAAPHLHEVPGVMWVPLVILAALSIVGGWVQIPDALPVLPGVDTLHAWLEPVFHSATSIMESRGVHAAHESPVGGGEAMWAGVSTVLAAIVIVLTFRAIMSRKVPAVDAPDPEGLAGILYNKWYVDELYDRMIIRPMLVLWHGCWRIVDVGLIDGTINGIAGGARLVGWFGSLFQTGRVATYLFFFVTGVVVILGTMLW